MKYRPWKFTKLANTEIGRWIWEYLITQEAFVRMQTATLMGRPAIEGISTPLENRLSWFLDDDDEPGFHPPLMFGMSDEKSFTRLKQMIGHMVKQIMLTHFYRVEKTNVRATSSSLFIRGARYWSSYNVAPFLSPIVGPRIIGLGFRDIQKEHLIKHLIASTNFDYVIEYLLPTTHISPTMHAYFIDPSYVGWDNYIGLLDLFYKARHVCFDDLDYNDKIFIQNQFTRDDEGKFTIDLPLVLDVNKFDTLEMAGLWYDKFEYQ